MSLNAASFAHSFLCTSASTSLVQAAQRPGPPSSVHFCTMLEALVWSSTVMGLGAAGYATATLNSLGMPVDLPLLLLSFLLVQSLYIRDRLAGSNGDDDATNEPARSAWLMRHGGKLKALAVAEGVLAVICMSLRPAVLSAIAPGMVFVMLYTARVLPGGRSLKQLPGLKVVYIGGLWNLLNVWIQYIYNTQGPHATIGAALLVGACQFCCEAALTNLNDLRDVEGDTKAGTLTLPVLLGRPAARCVSIGFAGVAMVVGRVAGAKGLAVTGLYVGLTAVLYDKRQQAMWSMLNDGTGIVAAVATTLLG